MTENQKQSAAEVLRAARASIEKWWVKGVLVETVWIAPTEVERYRQEGDTIVSYTEPGFPTEYSVVRGTCAIGAVSYAENLTYAYGGYNYPEDDDPVVVLLDAALPKKVWLRLGMSKAEWGRDSRGAHIITFNDGEGTTKRMVLNLFDRAIKLAEDPEYTG